jgi:hypothetical protein
MVILKVAALQKEGQLNYINALTIQKEGQLNYINALTIKKLFYQFMLKLQ